MPRRPRLIWCLIACVASGCGKSSLGSRDAGRDDGATDVTPDAAPVGGRHAFDVTVKLAFTSPLSAGTFGTDFPTSATATLVVDTTAGWLVIGGEGQGSTAMIAASGSALVLATPVTLYVPFSGACNGVATLDLSALSVTIGPDGKLHGTATGTARYLVGDVGYNQALTATLDGVPDMTRPALPIRTAGVLDPLAPARFAVSEPLPAGAKAQLVAFDGVAVELIPEMSQTGAPVIVTAFRVPSVLPFGGSYRLALDQVVDFAGNQAAQQQSPPLGTLAAPPLLADGGFETTPVGAMGDATVFAAGDLPVISGAQSLYLSPGYGQSLTFRLLVTPGSRSVFFSYRVTSTYDTVAGFFGTIVVGSAGSSIGSRSQLPVGTPTTKISQTGGTTLTIGPVSTAELSLPDPRATEVVLKIVTPASGCGLRPPAGGLIIDDVRGGP
jgi:hypothetical protein